jgi:hypothetical protein
VKVMDNQWTQVDESSPTLVNSFQLLQNYPNPFNQQTTIEYSLLNSGRVDLSIYNIIGQKQSSFSAVEQAGMHSFTWNGKNTMGQDCPSGLYVYKIRTENGIMARRMLLLR